MFKYYLEIIKPGIIIGNIFLIIGGFLLASRNIAFNFFVFLYTILGTSLVIASACVCNNLIDSDIDQKMQRTCNRILLKNILTPISVYIFSIFLGLLGVCILGVFVNYLAMSLSIFGFIVYVVLYTLLFKRKTVHSTLIGSFSGSTPSIIGYTAVSNSVDACSVLLFVIFIFWQMSHFYSISIIRIKDYKQASIPVFPVIKGILSTKKYIFFYILNFILFSALLTFFGYVSYMFLLVSFIMNFYWLILAYLNIKKNNCKSNEKQLFYVSIIVVVFFNFLLLLDLLI